MESSATAVRVTEAIPTPVRVVGWLLILGPVFVLLVDGPGRDGPLRAMIDQGLSRLGLGAGVAPVEFLAFAWLAVALLFWGQAHTHGQGLGRKSALVFVATILTQASLFLLATSTA